MLTQDQRDRFEVVLVAPRNPLNIGAVARAMANFDFPHLTVIAPYDPHWREARSAVGAPELLQNARSTACLAEAVAGCTFVAGTGTRTYRKPEQRVFLLPEAGPIIARCLEDCGRVALVFGPEKHGLTRDDLSYCHTLIEIPTDPRQPSMNLGQAVAVCLYEMTRHSQPDSGPGNAQAGFPTLPHSRRTDKDSPAASPSRIPPNSGALDRLGDLIEQTLIAAGYSPRAMQPANRHDLRLLLRRLGPSALDTRRMMGLFRRVLHRLQHPSGRNHPLV